MKDNQTKLEEIEVSHKLGGAGEGRVQGRGKWRVCRYYTDVKHCNTIKDVYDTNRYYYDFHETKKASERLR